MLKLIKSASRMANRLVAISLVLLFLKLFCLNQITELFNFGYQLGVVVDGILLSVISSYIFYLFVVHQKELIDRKKLVPYIKKHISIIVGGCVGQLDSISKYSSVELDFKNIDQAVLELAMSKISPHQEAPLLLGVNPYIYANWLQYFDHYKYRSQESVKRLFIQLPYLDSELILNLIEIDECSHFMGLTGTVGRPLKNTDLQAWSSSFYDYCLLCLKLESYGNEKLNN